MTYDIKSVFPYYIDSLLLISDPSLDKLEIITKQKEYITNNEYTKAAELIKTENEIIPINADLINALQYRTASLQKYLKELSAQEKIERAVHSPLEPTSVVPNGLCWISDCKLIKEES